MMYEMQKFTRLFYKPCEKLVGYQSVCVLFVLLMQHMNAYTYTCSDAGPLVLIHLWSEIKALQEGGLKFVFRNHLMLL